MHHQRKRVLFKQPESDKRKTNQQSNNSSNHKSASGNSLEIIRIPDEPKHPIPYLKPYVNRIALQQTSRSVERSLFKPQKSEEGSSDDKDIFNTLKDIGVGFEDQRVEQGVKGKRQLKLNLNKSPYKSPFSLSNVPSLNNDLGYNRTDDIDKLLNSRSRQNSRNSKLLQRSNRTFNLDKEFDVPNFERLKIFLRDNYMKNQHGKPYSICQAICASNVGELFSCFRPLSTIFDKGGPGLNLYFNFMRTTIFFFFVCLLLSIPLQYYNIRVYRHSTNPDLKPPVNNILTTVSNFFISTSLGAASSFSLKNYEFSFSNPNQTIYLSCDQGVVSVNPNYTRFGFVPKEQSLKHLSFGIDEACTNYTMVSLDMQGCIGNNFCELYFDLSWINAQKDCISRTSNKSLKGVLSLYCKAVTVPLMFGPGMESIPNSLNYYNLVAGSLGLFYFYYLLGLFMNERSIMKGYNKNHYLPYHYCLQIKSLPSGLSESDIVKDLKALIDQINHQITGKRKSPLIDIKVAQPIPIFILSRYLNSLVILRQQLLYRIKESLCLKLLPASSINTEKLRERLLKMEERIMKSPQPDKDLRNDIASALKLLQKFEENKEKIRKTEENIQRMKQIKRNIKSVFLTFKYRIQRDVFARVIPSSRYQAWSNLYGDFRIGNTRIYAVNPPNPINIDWMNLDKMWDEKFFRRLASWGCYLALFIIPIFMARVFENWKSGFRESLPGCSAFSSIINDKNIKQLALDWLPVEEGIKCLCITRRQLVDQELLEKVKLGSNFCEKLFVESRELVYLRYTESGFFALISVIFEFLFAFMAEQESYTNYNNSEASLLIKMFFWKFFISTLLPLLKSLNIYSDGSQTQNRYDDFTPFWYASEGANILLGMYVRCFLIVFGMFYRYLVPRLTQLYDRRFGFNCSVTRQITHKQYIRVYKNITIDLPLSYAEILNTIFIAFIFGTILPNMFVVCFFILVLIYYKDKILYLTTYRLKYQHDDTLLNSVRGILYLVPLLYIGIGVWIFGNSLYFSNDKHLEDVIIYSTGSWFVNKFNQTLVNTPINASINLGQFSRGEGVLKQDLDYRNEYELRTQSNPISQFMFFIFLIYTLFFTAQKCFNIAVGYFYRKQIMAGRSKYAISSEEIRFTALVPKTQARDQIAILACQNPMSKTQRRLDKKRIKELNKLLQKPPNMMYRFLTLASYDYQLNPKFKDFCIRQKEERMMNAPSILKKDTTLRKPNFPFNNLRLGSVNKKDQKKDKKSSFMTPKPKHSEFGDDEPPLKKAPSFFKFTDAEIKEHEEKEVDVSITNLTPNLIIKHNPNKVKEDEVMHLKQPKSMSLYI